MRYKNHSEESNHWFCEHFFLICLSMRKSQNASRIHHHNICMLGKQSTLGWLWRVYWFSVVLFCCKPVVPKIFSYWHIWYTRRLNGCRYFSSQAVAVHRSNKGFLLQLLHLILFWQSIHLVYLAFSSTLTLLTSRIIVTMLFGNVLTFMKRFDSLCCKTKEFTSFNGTNLFLSKQMKHLFSTWMLKWFDGAG